MRSVTVVFHLFFHYNTCKVHRGALVISVDDVNADRGDGVISEGNFSALPEGLSKVRVTLIPWPITWLCPYYEILLLGLVNFVSRDGSFSLFAGGL